MNEFYSNPPGLKIIFESYDDFIKNKYISKAMEGKDFLKFSVSIVDETKSEYYHFPKIIYLMMESISTPSLICGYLKEDIPEFDRFIYENHDIKNLWL